MNLAYESLRLYRSAVEAPDVFTNVSMKTRHERPDEKPIAGRRCIRVAGTTLRDL
jgi:hypothetical protein